MSASQRKVAAKKTAPEKADMDSPVGVLSSGVPPKSGDRDVKPAGLNPGGGKVCGEGERPSRKRRSFTPNDQRAEIYNGSGRPLSMPVISTTRVFPLPASPVLGDKRRKSSPCPRGAVSEWKGTGPHKRGPTRRLGGKRRPGVVGKTLGGDANRQRWGVPKKLYEIAGRFGLRSSIRRTWRRNGGAAREPYERAHISRASRPSGKKQGKLGAHAFFSAKEDPGSNNKEFSDLRPPGKPVISIRDYAGTPEGPKGALKTKEAFREISPSPSGHKKTTPGMAGVVGELANIRSGCLGVFNFWGEWATLSPVLRRRGGTRGGDEPLREKRPRIVVAELRGMKEGGKKPSPSGSQPDAEWHGVAGTRDRRMTFARVVAAPLRKGESHPPLYIKGPQTTGEQSLADKGKPL
ncbi:unnamed protein product [Arctia plantaginis]|uniref:Uncharacterized protein n=1 Tax=Arctia plantaginis TaxID=874455 RepID=A0A8S0Z994_ARCPL|nr:unnamed protein product [Arctia plantaginis]